MKISLITACYNSAETIGTAIQSVLSQKGVDVEYIVVDGGSKDGTVDIIKEYADKTLNSQLSTPNFTFRWLSERDNHRVPFWERGGFVVLNMNLQCFPCS